MKKFLILILPLIFVLNSCEEIVEGEILPYEEKLVIRAVFHQPTENYPYNDNRSIKITRTLPVLEEYSAEKAEVRDAEVFVEVDGQRYPCLYEAGSRLENSYYVFKGEIKDNKEYKLTVNWQGKTATAVMRIPKQPDAAKITIDSIVRDEYGNRDLRHIARALVKPQPGEAYSVTIITRDSMETEYFYYQPFEDVKRFDQVNTDGFVPVSAQSRYYFNEEAAQQREKLYFTVMVHAFDIQFYDYFLTRYNNRSESILSEPSKVKWNVKGNGIGMFTGYSTTAVELTQ